MLREVTTTRVDPYKPHPVFLWWPRRLRLEGTQRYFRVWLETVTAQAFYCRSGDRYTELSLTQADLDRIERLRKRRSEAAARWAVRAI